MPRMNLAALCLLIALAVPATASPIPPGTTPLRFFGFWWGPGYHSQNKWCRRGPAADYAWEPVPMPYPGVETLPASRPQPAASVMPAPEQVAPLVPERPGSTPPPPPQNTRKQSRFPRRVPSYISTPYGPIPRR